MYPVSSHAYDRAITVFSPDGRLFQVQYAQEAVKRGTTALGMIYDTGVLLAVDKNLSSRLVKPESVKKIFKADNHIGIAISGLVADARRLVEMARVEAQRNRILYGNEVDVETLTRELCDQKQMYTQYGGARPFGASLLITGVDAKGKRLFETDPSGAFTEYRAKAIGAGAKDAEEIFEKKYKPELSKDQAITLALSILSSVSENPLSTDTLDVAFIDETERVFHELSIGELEKHISVSSGEKKK
jgi:proteasome alpha subunit